MDVNPSKPWSGKTVSEFRSPHSGARYSRTMFWEQQQLLPIEDRLMEPRYTLQVDKPGLVNFRRVYVDLGDPTGYKLSQLYLEDYGHWQFLMKSPWFREAKEQWDLELDAKLKSEAMDVLRMYSNGIEGVSPAVQLTAAKYLANAEHRPKETKVALRGRPSKAEVDGELKREAASAADLASDLDRIRLAKG